MVVYLNIGSNLGDRLASVNLSVAGLIQALPAGGVYVSQPFESKAWGYDSGHDYINIGVAINLSAPMSAEDVLRVTQGVQNSIDASSHRDDAGGYTDRVIDIDIIAIDDMVYESDRLIIPHPRMHLREFVLVPMSEVAPGWVHPVTGKTAAEMLEALRAGDMDESMALSQTFGLAVL